LGKAYTYLSMTQLSCSVFGSVAADHAVAGFLSGLSSSALLHPFDLVKTRLQVQHTGSLTNGRGKPILYRNTIDALRLISRTEGFPALYKGVGPGLVGNTIAWGGYFWCYEKCKQALQGWKTTPLTPLDQILAGMGAGCAVLCVTNPIWVLKTRALLDVSEKEQPRYFRGFVGELRHLWQRGGVAALYKGVGPGFIGTTHGALQIMAYERIRAWRFRGMGLREGAGHRLKGLDYIFCAATSKSFAAIVTYPYQVIRSRMQDPHLEYSGMMDCVRSSIKNEGVRGLYRGLTVNTFKVLPSCCVIFWVYEEVTFRLSEMANRGVRFRAPTLTR